MSLTRLAVLLLMALFVMAQWSLPVQADNSAALRELRAWANTEQLVDLLAAAQKVGGFPEDDQHWPYDLRAGVEDASYAAFTDALGEDAGATVYAAWNTFLWAHERTELALPPGIHIDDEFALLLYDLDPPVDVTGLAHALLVLAHAGELAMSIAGREPTLTEPFRWEEGNLVLVVTGSTNDTHTEDVDFLIDLGGDDEYLNNAGGTRSARPTALCVDLSGNDRYKSSSACQGAGLLGIGGLIDCGGDDTYIVEDLGQGVALYGAGFLWDKSGNDDYVGEHFCQGSAHVGFALLWDGAGDDSYSTTEYAHTLSSHGASFLIDMGGQDVFANTTTHRSIAGDTYVETGD